MENNRIELYKKLTSALFTHGEAMHFTADDTEVRWYELSELKVILQLEDEKWEPTGFVFELLSRTFTLMSDGTISFSSADDETVDNDEIEVYRAEETFAAKIAEFLNWRLELIQEQKL